MSRNLETFLFALESDWPDSWKIRSTLLSGPKIQNLGRKQNQNFNC